MDRYRRSKSRERGNAMEGRGVTEFITPMLPKNHQERISKPQQDVNAYSQNRLIIQQHLSSTVPTDPRRQASSSSIPTDPRRRGPPSSASPRAQPSPAATPRTEPQQPPATSRVQPQPSAARIIPGNNRNNNNWAVQPQPSAARIIPGNNRNNSWPVQPQPSAARIITGNNSSINNGAARIAMSKPIIANNSGTSMTMTNNKPFRWAQEPPSAANSLAFGTMTGEEVRRSSAMMVTPATNGSIGPQQQPKNTLSNHVEATPPEQPEQPMELDNNIGDQASTSTTGQSSQAAEVISNGHLASNALDSQLNDQERLGRQFERHWRRFEQRCRKIAALQEMLESVSEQITAFAESSMENN